MKLDSKGIERNTTKIESLIDSLKNANDVQLWDYMGLQVEIDPTIDYNNENILIRWSEIEEEFNDKIIVYSLLEFQSLFKPLNLC